MKKMNNNNKKKVVAYDIETIAQTDLSDETILSFCKIGNLKDPAKIKKKQAEAWGKLGCNPLTAKAICGGYHGSDEDSGYFMCEDDSDEAEKEFLIKYWAKLDEYETLVGFNSVSFDARILLLRSAVHRINIPFKPSMKRYDTTGNHLDLRNILAGSNPFEAGSLSFYLNMFSLQGKTPDMDGSLVQSYWEEGLHQEIGTYCERDCQQTMALFQRIKHYFL